MSWKNYFRIFLIFSFVYSSFAQNEQTKLSMEQYFSVDMCFHEQSSLNYPFARGIDIHQFIGFRDTFFSKQHPEIIEGDLQNQQLADSYIINPDRNDFWNQLIFLTFKLKRDEDNFMVGKKLGEGKFSDVYIGYDKQKNYQKVAIKILRPNKVQKIHREIQILKKVDSINNIAHLLGLTVNKELLVPSLVFEYMPGKTLKQSLLRLNERDIRYYSYLLLEALRDSHALGVIHKDIKGANILIDHEKRQLKLIDWGLSDIYSPELISYNRIGTNQYKAPEILLREYMFLHFSPAVDIWSAGICIGGMMFNKLPFITGDSPSKVLLQIIEIFGYEDIFKLSALNGVDLETAIYHQIQADKEKYTPKGKGLKSLIQKENEKYASDEGIDFISKMLSIFPSERISAAESLQHPFFDPIRDAVEQYKQKKD